MAERSITVRISRFNPAVDRSSYFQTYGVPLSPRMTVMDILNYIYEYLDPTIAYNAHTACHRRICARCNLNINGKAGLACQTEAKGDLTLAPLPHIKVVRDLVVEGI